MNQAFDAKTIVETRAGSLRSHAVAEVRAWTDSGLLYVRRAADIRWTPNEPFGAIHVGDQWIPQNERGLIAWAIDEGLNWQRPDGSIVLWESADLLSSAGDSGGGYRTHGSDLADASILNALGYWEGGIGGGGDPDGLHKPLYKMTASEARRWAIETQARVQRMIDELNLIPGVKASGTVTVEIDDIDADSSGNGVSDDATE